jgi:hypothetical protein
MFIVPSRVASNPDRGQNLLIAPALVTAARIVVQGMEADLSGGGAPAIGY